MAENAVYILGSGTPNPTPERFGSSFVLDVGGHKLMFDCGPAATHKLVKAGLWPTDIEYLFFTHHHFDHDVDLPCFLLCRWDQSVDGESVLQVYGPSPTAELVHGILDESDGVFAHDWIARVNHPLSQRVHVNRGGKLPRPKPEVDAFDIHAGAGLQGDGWSITTAEAKHVQPYLDSIAYRVDTADGNSVVFTGDTEPCESVTQLAEGADLMLCMCVDSQDALADKGMHLGQSGTTAAAQMAHDAGVKRLALVHINPHLSQHGAMEQGIGDVSEVYDGEIIFTHEVMRIDL